MTGESGGVDVVLSEGVESPITPEPLPEPLSEIPFSDLSREEQTLLLRMAQDGNPDALKCIFQTMLAEPARGAHALDLTRHVRQELIIATFGEDNDLARELYSAKAEMIGARLLSEAGPSPLEHLLTERAATCWLAAEMADIDAASQEEHHAPGRHADYYARRQDRAHKRFLQSVEALTRMRRLLSPLPLVGQVNIAEPGAQQMNIAATMMREEEASSGHTD